jgi:hypothetical protein
LRHAASSCTNSTAPRSFSGKRSSIEADYRTICNAFVADLASVMDSLEFPVAELVLQLLVQHLVGAAATRLASP